MERTSTPAGDDGPAARPRLMDDPDDEGAIPVVGSIGPSAAGRWALFKIDGVPHRLRMWTDEEFAAVPEAERPNARPLVGGGRYLIEIEIEIEGG